MIAMIIVSITTDWLRYKIVIVIQALCGVSIYILLSFCTSFTSVIVSNILINNIIMDFLKLYYFKTVGKSNFIWIFRSYRCCIFHIYIFCCGYKVLSESYKLYKSCTSFRSFLFCSPCSGFYFNKIT